MKVSAVTVCECDRLTLLRHWLAWYAPRADAVTVLLQRDNAGIPCDEAISLCREFAALPVIVTLPYDTWDVRQIVQRACASVREGWIMCPDADEFVDSSVDLRALAVECEGTGFLYVGFRMVDRIAADGSFPTMLPDIPLHVQFPIAADITNAMLGGCVGKCAFFRHGRFGHHGFDGTPAERIARRHPATLTLDHYKWDATAPARLERRVAMLRRKNRPWLVESERFLAAIDADPNALALK